MMKYLFLILVSMSSVLNFLESCEREKERSGDSFEDIVPSYDNKTTTFEIPSYTRSEDIVRYSGFTASYNHTTLCPNWVAYELTYNEVDGDYDNKNSNFSRDPNLNGPQASREDYSNSGWDKGHMAPKADMRWSSQAYWQSFYFTNICPQNHKFNAGDWNTLEKSVRNWARKYERIWIVCGPIFTDHKYGTIGNAKVQVPDKFFKALLIKTGSDYQSIAFVMSNNGEHHPQNSYAMSVDQLEEIIHRDLFPNLDDPIETAVERDFDLSYWR